MKPDVAFFVQRSLDDYKKLSASVRTEVFMIARRGYALRPSADAMAWWHRLPGLPRDNRVVFTAIRDGGHP